MGISIGFSFPSIVKESTPGQADGTIVVPVTIGNVGGVNGNSWAAILTAIEALVGVFAMAHQHAPSIQSAVQSTVAAVNPPPAAPSFAPLPQQTMAQLQSVPLAVQRAQAMQAARQQAAPAPPPQQPSFEPSALAQPEQLAQPDLAEGAYPSFAPPTSDG